MRSKILHPLLLATALVATPFAGGILTADAHHSLAPTENYVPFNDTRHATEITDWELIERIKAIRSAMAEGKRRVSSTRLDPFLRAALHEANKRRLAIPDQESNNTPPKSDESKSQNNNLGGLLKDLDVQIQIGGDNNGITIAPKDTRPAYDPSPVLRDRRPAADLNRRQLADRIALAQQLADDDRATNRQRNRLLRVVRQDRAELDRRRAEAEARDAFDPSPVLNDRRRARDLNNRQLRNRIAKATELRDNRFATNNQRRRLDRVISRDQAELDRRREARRAQEEEERRNQNAEARALAEHRDNINDYLTFNRRPSRLTDAQLRRRIALGDTLREDDRTTRRQSNLIRRKARAYLAELNNRIAAATGQDQADQDPNRLARRILRNARAAEDLSDRQLRDRISSIRSTLPLVGLTDRNRSNLRALLANDRAELRDRVAQAQAREQAEALARERQRERRLAAAAQRDLQLRDLLRDRRSASRLGTPALRQRIQATVEALELPNLTRTQERRLRALLQRDRRTLRQRLAERRRDRQRELQTGNLSIIIDLDARPERRSTIALAEVLNEELQEQLIAPPTGDIDDVYTLDDLRDQPGLRNLMPGVEVDTVRFASGESVVREEEIPELERLGEIIERILDENPDEVFVIEGHTDLVGSEEFNLGLSEDRAQAVRDALLDFFLIDENALVTIGYGEQFPKIPTTEAEQENRRVTVRRITPLIDESYARR